MMYDKVIDIELENCIILSGTVESDESRDPTFINIWMLRDRKRILKTTTSYVVYNSPEKKYVSDVLYLSEDYIRLKFIEQKTTKIYIDTKRDTYFFDLDFLELKA